MMVSRRIPILTYHSLDDSRSVISTSPHDFRTQLKYLLAMGWRTLGLDELLASKQEGGWPAQSFVVTFDDGFANFAMHGLPVLVECGFSAIVFVVSDWVGRTNDWDRQPSWVPRHPLLNWKSLREIAAMGVEIGAHTRSHPNLTALEYDRAERELVDGKRWIEDQLGVAVRSFAYPYGATTPKLQAIVGRHFDAAFGTRLGFTRIKSSNLDIERIDMYYLQHSFLFRGLHRRWVADYLWGRQQFRNVRRLVQGDVR